MKLLKRITDKNAIIYWIAFAIVVLIFHISYGLEVLVPTNINWLLAARHDWGQHYLGWAFYRHEPWTFPLGKINNLCYPVGTNVGYWDSIPLLALFFKIFSPLLPDNFQYLGMWLLFCHVMMAYYTIRILSLYNVRTVYVILSVLLIACNPMLVYRGMHPSLCAHFFILASVYYYLKPATAQTANQLNRNQVVLLILSSLVSPYLCMMVMGFNFILPFSHFFYKKALTLKQALIYPVISVIGVVMCWIIFGMVDFGDTVNLEVTNSYGLYGFNLNSFFNSMGYATLTPILPQVSEQQYEGYLYLGVGVMLLIAISISALILNPSRTRKMLKRMKFLTPLLILSFLLALFAISNKVTFGNKVLFQYPIPSLIMKFGGVFRASGRFFWVAYYLFLTFFIIVYTKMRLPEYVKLPVLVILLGIQAYDTKLIYTGRNLQYGNYDTPLDDKKWINLMGDFGEVVTYPPFNNNLLNHLDYQDLCFLALKAGKPITTGYAARENGAKNSIYLDTLNSKINMGIISDRQLFVTTPRYLNNFDVLLHNKQVKLHYLDGYYYLYSNKAKVRELSDSPQGSFKVDSITRLYSKTNIGKVIDRPLFAKDKATLNIEKLNYAENFIQISGWAFITEENNNRGDSIFVTLSDAKKTYVTKANKVLRPDVTGTYNKENLDDSGFSLTVFTDNIPKTQREVGLAIKKKNGDYQFIDLGSFKNNGKTDYAKPTTYDKLPATGKLIGNIDEFIQTAGKIKISGWAAIEKEDATNNLVKLVLIGKKSNYAFSTDIVKRQDVTDAAKNKFNYNDSGFNVKIRLADIPKGQYKVGLSVTNTKTNTVFLMNTGRVLDNN